MFVAGRPAASTCKANAWFPEPVEFGSNSLDEAVHDPLLAGLIERNRELVAVDMRHIAISKLLMEDAVAEAERGHGPGRFGDQFTLDGEGQAALWCLCSRLFGMHRLNVLILGVVFPPFLEPAARLARLRALPAWRRVVRAEALHFVET